MTYALSRRLVVSERRARNSNDDNHASHHASGYTRGWGKGKVTSCVDQRGTLAGNLRGWAKPWPPGGVPANLIAQCLFLLLQITECSGLAVSASGRTQGQFAALSHWRATQ